MYITIIKRLVKIINCKLLKYTNINSNIVLVTVTY